MIDKSFIYAMLKVRGFSLYIDFRMRLGENLIRIARGKMKKSFLLVIPIVLILTGCEIKTSVIHDFSSDFKDMGMTPIANAIDEFTEENAEYHYDTDSAEFYQVLSDSAVSSATIVTDEDGNTKVGNSEIGYITFSYPCETAENIVYTSQAEEGRIITVEINRLNGDPSSIIDAYLEQVQSNYANTELLKGDDPNVTIIRSIPNTPYMHYWYLTFREKDNQLYYTSITTIGYPEEDSIKIYEDLINTRTYP